MNLKRPLRLLFVSILLFLPTAAVADDGLSISGVVWQDANLDGVRQDDEPPFPVGNVVLVTKAGERRTRVGEDGRYAFEGLAPGPYRVRLESAHAWSYLTAPVRQNKGPYEVGLTLTSESVDNVDFGLANFRDAGLPIYEGMAVRNGALVDGPRISALVGNKDCAGPVFVRPPHFHPASYMISIASDELIPGCAKPGDTVRFAVNGQVANETVVWQPRRHDTHDWPFLDLIAGPPVAWWGPDVRHEDETIWDWFRELQAFVGGTLCGSTRLSFPYATLVVASDELRTGCGVEGATVTFVIDGLPVQETAVWSAGNQGVLRLTLPVPPDAESLVSSLFVSDDRLREAGLRVAAPLDISESSTRLSVYAGEAACIGVSLEDEGSRGTRPAGAIAVGPAGVTGAETGKLLLVGTPEQSPACRQAGVVVNTYVHDPRTGRHTLHSFQLQPGQAYELTSLSQDASPAPGAAAAFAEAPSGGVISPPSVGDGGMR